MTTEFTSFTPRLAYVLTQPSTPSEELRLAVFAHPYPRFGGTKDDPLLRGLARRLTREGWWTLRYDSRGAGESEGSCSFTAQAEIRDHTTLIESVFQPIIDNHKNRNRITLLQIGYSYGSLASSMSSPALHRHQGDMEVRRKTVLISYPLGVLFAITLFRSNYFLDGLEERLRTARDSLQVQGQAGSTVVPSENDLEGKKGSDLLLIYGDRDQFTAVEKLRGWSSRLEVVGGERVTTREITGADHFWREESGRNGLITALFDWLE